MKKTIYALLLFCLGSQFAAAQSLQNAVSDSLFNAHKIVELDVDKKLIYVNELGLPPNTPIVDVLALCPEFLNRDMASVVNNYDVQIDDISILSDTKYDVLLHTMISEVHHIEITTDPSYAESADAVGGAINIAMNKAEQGLDGRASLDVSTDLDFMPAFNLSYTKDKLTIYGSAYCDYYDYMTRETNSSNRLNQYNYAYRENFYKGLSQGAKFGLVYDFTSHHKLTFWVMQQLENSFDSVSSYTTALNYDAQKTFKDGTLGSSSPILNSQVSAILKFERFYDRPTQKFSISLTYNNNYKNSDSRSHYSGDQYSLMDYYTYEDKYISRPSNINFSTFYRFHLLPSTSEHELRLKVGVNAKLSLADGTSVTSKRLYGSVVSYSFTADDHSRNLNATPYAIFYYKWRNLNMEFGMRYRFNALFSRGEDEEWQSNYFHNFIGHFNITYQPAASHMLRASTSRTLVPPSNIQLNGMMFYNMSSDWFQQGNTALEQATLHNVDLQYAYHFKNARHDLQLLVAAEYVNAQNLIEAVIVTDKESGVECHTWQNSTLAKHIVDGRFSLFWQTSVFSLSFSANVFDKITPSAANKPASNNFYYNICLRPILKFEKGWILSGDYVYNSKFNMGATTLGDAMNITVNLSKAFGPWSIRCKFENVFDYLSADVTKNDSGVSTKYYHQYHCVFVAGFTYSFGAKWSKKRS